MTVVIATRPKQAQVVINAGARGPAGPAGPSGITANSGVSAGTYGGTGFVPVFTVGANGIISFAANVASAAASFTLKGDTGTDLFNTGDTLTIKGSDYISTVATDNTIAISLAPTLSLTSLTVNSTLTFSIIDSGEY